MVKQLSLAAALLATSTAALVPATPALAQRGYYGGRYDRGAYQDRGYRDDRGYRGESYRGRRSDRRCDNTGGTVIGAIAGGLLGRSIAGRGDHLLGTVLGAGGGALAGRAIDRSDDPRYCRR